MNRFAAFVAPAVLVGILAFAVGPGAAQSPAPDEFTREALIRSALLTFNDANTTGIYDVLRAKSATPFQEAYTAEQLAETFKIFREQEIDLLVVAAMDPVESGEPTFNEDGGHDAHRPLRNAAAADQI